jgi:hypothetical protein
MNILPAALIVSSLVACAQTSVSAPGEPESAQAKASPAARVSWVYRNGSRYWGVENDMSYGNYDLNYKDTSGSPLEGKYDLKLTGTQGGWQPGAPFDEFDTTGFNYVLVQLKPTQPGNSWISSFMGAHDTGIPGSKMVDVGQFCDQPFTPGQWSTCKIPLHDGGYNLPARQKVYKIMFQEQAESVGTNTWYVNNVGLSP